MNTQVHVLKQVEPLNRAINDALLRVLEAALSRRGRFSWALAGGSTPRTLYEYIVKHDLQRIPWDKVYIFWGDERLVPPDDANSNHRMAQDTLLSRVPIPPENVFSMASTLAPDEAAVAYERRLRDFFRIAGEGFPSFDLILLGMGADGHTASLFPGHPALDETRKWVAGLLGPATRPPRERITLTLPVINRAENVFFLVTGAAKREALNRILNQEEAAQRYPAARVNPQGALHWFVDEAARG